MGLDSKSQDRPQGESPLSIAATMLVNFLMFGKSSSIPPLLVASTDIDRIPITFRSIDYNVTESEYGGGLQVIVKNGCAKAR